MEKLHRAQFGNPAFKESEAVAQNPIKSDNRPISIENGDEKMLDCLSNMGNIAKGSLGAKGSIKLRPSTYGTYSPYERKENFIEPKMLEQEDEYKNSWDNIFLKQSSDYDNNFFTSPQYMQYC